ncbi:Sec63 [Aspergillus chevalieri]|uniref:Sec63 n=1 Tax=Aspergillus chevalieri TaxID=182096 RepID=A0A7R7ZHZ3_ASPCH|nr:Sec63 [Aspergillus chevalieri]BCR83135.1 Sec63 [Aspergillus chevalieri]
MRRKPFKPPYQRRNGDESSSNRPIKRSGIIDQRLIEGAQVSMPFFSQFRMNGDGDGDEYQRRGLGSSLALETYTGVEGSEGNGVGEEDMQLDAFDLQLLAQKDRAMNNGRDIMRGNRPPKQVSRFFPEPDSHITPHRGIASSSSELDVGSSPLTKFHQDRTERKMVAAGPASVTELSSQTEGSPSSHLDVEGMAARAGQSQSLQQTTTASMTPFQNIPMSIRGIVLVSVHELPDNYRSIFPFPVFNAIQSKCFRAIYHQNDNIVLASPTGSGKTVIMELAICRLLGALKDERFKVVYQAPTKSLCSERFRDWSKKFMTLGLQCAELTGDTDQTQLRSVQSAQIIITTPEKWDSMTRKWKDHAQLMQLVKLFLVDEVHILKETRGATLEAVVSRMKSIRSNVRFVALSATVPNSEDIATWLGKDATNQHMPAHREHFGEEFRPVKLQKFVYGYQSSGNDFAFDKMCSGKCHQHTFLSKADYDLLLHQEFFCCYGERACSTLVYDEPSG